MRTGSWSSGVQRGWRGDCCWSVRMDKHEPAPTIPEERHPPPAQRDTKKPACPHQGWGHVSLPSPAPLGHAVCLHTLGLSLL